ncbi:MAG: carbon-nitrogen family hydrolase [Egibacteraceae bacterium]
MRVAVVQHDIVWEDAQATCARLEPWIAAAAGAGARLIVLAEMFATGFSMHAERIAEPPGGPTTQFLCEQAAEHDVWLAGSLAEQPPEADRPFNTLTVAGPAGELERYRKRHPFTYAGEHEHFAAGDDLVTVTIEGLRCSLFVCYDLRFADGFWAVADRTDCYLVPANWPETRRGHWTALLEARAIENQAYVVGCNRVGSGGALDYTGDSRIIDPSGSVLAAASGGESLLLAEIDPRVVAQTRERLPFMRDRRG